MERNALSSSETQNSVEIQHELDDLADVDGPDTQPWDHIAKVKKRPLETLPAAGARKRWWHFPPDGIFTLAPKDSALSALLFALYVACSIIGIVCVFVG